MQANTVFSHNNKTYNIGDEIDVKNFTGKELKELELKDLIAKDVTGRLKKEANKKAKDMASLEAKETKE